MDSVGSVAGCTDERSSSNIYRSGSEVHLFWISLFRILLCQRGTSHRNFFLFMYLAPPARYITSQFSSFRVSRSNGEVYHISTSFFSCISLQQRGTSIHNFLLLMHPAPLARYIKLQFLLLMHRAPIPMFIKLQFSPPDTPRSHTKIHQITIFSF